MKQGWEIKKLGEVCKLTNGYAFQSKYYTDDGYFVIRIGNVQDGYIELTNPKYIKLGEEKQKKFILGDGDILVSLTGNVGRVGIMREEHLPAVLNQRVAKIAIASTKLDKNYLFYFLTSDYFISELIKAGRGAAQQNISTTDIENLEITLPAPPEQKRIVAILDEAFTAFDKVKANAEQNLKNAKELFESYLQGVFENGKNWQKQKLGDVCGFVRGPFGGSLKKNIFKPNGFAVYEQQHAIYNQFDNVRYYIDEKKFNEMKRFELNAGDLIMSCSGTMGKIAIVPTRIKKGIINQALLKLSPSKKVSNEFLKLWMQSESFQSSLREYAGGAAIQNVASVAILKNIEIPLPDISIQKSIVQKVHEFSTETKKLESVYQKKMEYLEEMKKSILKKAFAGELAS
jgi:type I restriction enzyme S subunit